MRRKATLEIILQKKNKDSRPDRNYLKKKIFLFQTITAGAKRGYFGGDVAINKDDIIVVGSGKNFVYMFVRSSTSGKWDLIDQMEPAMNPKVSRL